MLIKYIILLLIVISFSNCSKIQFDNSIVQQCIASNPCSLTTNSVWVGGATPVNGDDVVIDFSGLTNGNQVIYLFGENLNVDLNSFSLDGGFDNGFYTNLLIYSSQITTSTIFNVTSANVTFTDGKMSFDTFESNNVNLTVDGETSFQSNGFNANGDQPILITDQSLLIVDKFSTINSPFTHTSQKQLVLSGDNLITANFESNGTIQIDTLEILSDNTTLNNVDLLSKNSSIKIFSQLEITGTINNDKVVYSGQVILNQNCDLLLPSGYTINDESNSGNIDGDIKIQDSNSTTIVNNIGSKSFTIETLGDLQIINSDFFAALVYSNSSVLSISGNSSLGSFYCQGTTNIEESSLFSLAAQGNFMVMNVYGSVEFHSNINGETINVYSTGSLDSYGFRINSNIFGYNATNISFENTEVTTSLSLSNSTFSTFYPFFQLQQLSVVKNSSINLYNMVTNNNSPAIISFGDVTIDDSVKFFFTFSNEVVKIKSGDYILLLSTNGTSNSINIDKNLFDFDGFTNLDYKVSLENTGDYYIRFYGSSNSGSGDHSEDGSSASKLGFNIIYFYLISIILLKLFI